MTGLGNDGAAGGGRGHLRASHADRERVVGQLKAAYVYGLVTKDESDERVAHTFASRTFADLALVTADIPAGLPALPPLPRPAAPTAPAGATAAPGDRALMVATAATAIATILALAAGLFLANPAAGLLVIAGAGSAVATLLLVARQVRGPQRRGMRDGGQLPPRQAAATGPRAGLRPRSATPPQLPPASLLRRGRANTASGRGPRPRLAG